jgi:hypothetical protein
MKNAWRRGQIMNGRERDEFILIRSDPRDPWASLFMFRCDKTLVMENAK